MDFEQTWIYVFHTVWEIWMDLYDLEGVEWFWIVSGRFIYFLLIWKNIYSFFDFQRFGWMLMEFEKDLPWFWKARLHF